MTENELNWMREKRRHARDLVALDEPAIAEHVIDILRRRDDHLAGVSSTCHDMLRLFHEGAELDETTTRMAQDLESFSEELSVLAGKLRSIKAAMHRDLHHGNREKLTFHLYHVWEFIGRVDMQLDWALTTIDRLHDLHLKGETK